MVANIKIIVATIKLIVWDIDIVGIFDKFDIFNIFNGMCRS